jgi:hypothetical protein
MQFASKLLATSSDPTDAANDRCADGVEVSVLCGFRSAIHNFEQSDRSRERHCNSETLLKQK